MRLRFALVVETVIGIAALVVAVALYMGGVERARRFAHRVVSTVPVHRTAVDDVWRRGIFAPPLPGRSKPLSGHTAAEASDPDGARP